MKLPLEVLRLYPSHDYTLPGALASRMPAKDREFIRFGTRTWTWASFDVVTKRLAAVLRERGIRQGDRVAIMARNSDGHVVALFALARLRAIMVPVNPDFGITETSYVLANAAVSGVLATADLLDVVRSSCGDLKQQPWLMSLDEAAADAPLVWSLTDAAREIDQPVEASPDDSCVIIYTSGTTGFPKGAVHSQRSYLLAGEAFIQRVHLQETDRVMIILPMYHMNALFYSVSGTLAAGASMAIVPKFSASTFWQTAVEVGATEVNIIEAIGTILVARPESEYRPEHRIRAVYGVRYSVADIFQERFGIHHLVGGYGMTEIPGVTCNPHDRPLKPGSMGPIGQHPDPDLPWAQLRIVDDEGNDVGDNEVGELWAKTPIIMQGYFGDPEQTAAAFRDGWFMTGDLVRRDEEGYYFFVSRKKDIIRRRGENISGAELDRVIAEHPDVYEVAAIAVPAELGEDEILAAVVAKPGREISAASIADWCRERLAPMKVPRYVAFLDELPHTPTHKVSKAALRQDKTLRERAHDLQRA